MENSSRQTSAISPRETAYYRRRQQNRLFSKLADFFAGEAKGGRISRKEIARKLGKDPAQITRWLSSPSNFELDTISDLLLAMGAELDLNIVRFVDRPKPNFAHPLSISHCTATNPSGVAAVWQKHQAGPTATTQPSIKSVRIDAPV